MKLRRPLFLCIFLISITYSDLARAMPEPAPGFWQLCGEGMRNIFRAFSWGGPKTVPVIELSPLACEPNSEKIIIGVLVQMTSGKIVFGVTRFWGSGHKAIYDAIVVQQGAIQRILWSGELRLRNDGKDQSSWKIVEANETSGHYRGPKNNLYHLQAIVKARQLPWFSKDTVFKKFNLEDMHLHTTMNSPDYRILQITHAAETFLNYVLRVLDGQSNPNSAQEMDHVMDVLSLLNLLDVSGVNTRVFRDTVVIFEKILSGGELEQRGYHLLFDGLERINKFVREPSPMQFFVLQE